MAWFECTGGSGGGGSGSAINAIAVFEDGEYKNTDIITHVDSPTGTSITIDENNYLVIPVAGSGIRFNTDITNYPDQYTLIFEIQDLTPLEASGYAQYGTCATDADAYRCMTTGSGRYSYGYCSPYGETIYQIFVGDKRPTDNYVFFAGARIKIKSIYCIFGNTWMALGSE